MRNPGIKVGLLSFLPAILLGVQGAGTAPLPSFDELYKLLRSNLSDMSAEELDHAAVRGLITELQPRVMLMTNGAPESLLQEIPTLVKSTVYDGVFAYFRIGRVGAGLDSELAQAWAELSKTNKLKGAVVDLRFSAGTNYAAAAATADHFADSEQPLLQWGTSSARSTQKQNAIKVPMAVLVNQQTSGAAEALAGILRELRAGLLIGATTAGRASTYKDFTLAQGQRLRVATGAITLGSGKALPAQGLKPDIQVELSLEDERAYFENPYRVAPKSLTRTETFVAGTNQADPFGTNRTSRRRINEAELVRLQREGLAPDQESGGRLVKESESGRVIVTDPALTRALDLLKGLALVQPTRPL